MNQSELLSLFTDEEKDILFDIPMNNDVILNRKEYRFLLRILDTEHLKSEYNWNPDTYFMYQESNNIAIENYAEAGEWPQPSGNPIAGESSTDEETWTCARDLTSSFATSRPPLYHPRPSLPDPVLNSPAQIHIRALRMQERRDRHLQRQRSRLLELEALQRLRAIEAMNTFYESQYNSDTE